jgi:hypothetical protein
MPLCFTMWTLTVLSYLCMAGFVVFVSFEDRASLE